MSSSIEIVQIPCRSNSYGYLVHHTTSRLTAAIDTPDASAYCRQLSKRGWKLTHIFNTHHHWEQTGGNLELKFDFPDVKIYGPNAERDRIVGLNYAVGEGDKISFGGTNVKVLDVGGHTMGHVAYHFEDESKIFVGDTLYPLGCGKMIEGTPPQYWKSVEKLRSLPDETAVYCAIECTVENAKFALSIEPGNGHLKERFIKVSEKRSMGKPTVPFNLNDEKDTNPFLRVDVSDEIRRKVGAEGDDDAAEVFWMVLRARDEFNE